MALPRVAAGVRVPVLQPPGRDADDRAPALALGEHNQGRNSRRRTPNTITATAVAEMYLQALDWEDQDLYDGAAALKDGFKAAFNARPAPRLSVGAIRRSEMVGEAVVVDRVATVFAPERVEVERYLRVAVDAWLSNNLFALERRPAGTIRLMAIAIA